MKLRVYLKRSHKSLESLKVLLESRGVEVFTKQVAISDIQVQSLLYQSDEPQNHQLKEIQSLCQAHPRTPLYLFEVEPNDPVLAGVYFRAGVTDFIPRNWENEQIFQCLLQLCGISIRFLHDKTETNLNESETYHSFHLSQLLQWFPQGQCAFPLYIRTPLTRTLVKFRETHEILEEKDIQHLRYHGIQHCLVPRAEFIEWSDLQQLKVAA